MITSGLALVLTHYGLRGAFQLEVVMWNCLYFNRRKHCLAVRARPVPGCQELLFSLSSKAKRPGTRPTKQTRSFGDHNNITGPRSPGLGSVQWLLVTAVLSLAKWAHLASPEREVSWIYFLFPHSWLINTKKSCPLLINFAFYHDDVLMKLSIYNSKAGVNLLSGSDG